MLLIKLTDCRKQDLVDNKLIPGEHFQYFYFMECECGKVHYMSPDHPHILECDECLRKWGPLKYNAAYISEYPINVISGVRGDRRIKLMTAYELIDGELVYNPSKYTGLYIMICSCGLEIFIHPGGHLGNNVICECGQEWAVFKSNIRYWCSHTWESHSSGDKNG